MYVESVGLNNSYLTIQFIYLVGNSLNFFPANFQTNNKYIGSEFFFFFCMLKKNTF